MGSFVYTVTKGIRTSVCVHNVELRRKSTLHISWFVFCAYTNGVICVHVSLNAGDASDAGLTAEYGNSVR
jgi:hypothetical protein